jgi:CMP-N,N'-diacetyllegionaminic acid synthase
VKPTAIAIIIGRGGSKGLPGKNMRPVAGKPCAWWTIRAAQQAPSVADIVVSSDDSALLALAERERCHAVQRPAPLASDTATVDSAARHALAAIAPLAADPRTPIVLLYANVPVRPDGLIDRAVELLISSHADSVQSYAPVGKHHPWWTARVSDDGQVRPWEGDMLNHGVFRRQDLPPAFIPDGGVIVTTRAAMMLEIDSVPAGPHAFFGNQRRGVTNPEGSVVDIDSHIDLLVADAILRDGTSVPAGSSA